MISTTAKVVITVGLLFVGVILIYLSIAYYAEFGENGGYVFTAGFLMILPGYIQGIDFLGGLLRKIRPGSGHNHHHH